MATVNVSLRCGESMVDAMVGKVLWRELILRKQRGDGFNWSWTGSLGALGEDLIYTET